MCAVTMWIVGDFEKVSGRKLLFNALKHVVSVIYSLSFLPILLTHHLLSIREHLGRNDHMCTRGIAQGVQKSEQSLQFQ